MGALADFVLGVLKQGLYAQWLRFLFEVTCSAVVSFLGTCGGILAGGGRPSIAIGCGMLAAAGAILFLFQRESSKLTKGMMLALPSSVLSKEQETAYTTIEKPK
jgi:hypothetical protein